MSTDTNDAPLSVKFANSNIPDDVLLRLADSVTVARANREDRYSARHSSSSQVRLMCALLQACKARNIDTENGVKVATQTINLLV
ncbi:MAG: hypothetical protein [Caudoviricetes sp.]|nr:MAG: hypothetical protein [Caudoviricetes sp.]